MERGVIDENCYYSFAEIKQLDPEFGERWNDLVRRSETAFKPDYFDEFENKYATQLAEFDEM